MSDTIRILRVIEYVGERAAVENHLRYVLQGEKLIKDPAGVYRIKAATLGVVPEKTEFNIDHPAGPC
jgi:lysophospholipase L1-like esterase